jgi:hypothetical protein
MQELEPKTQTQGTGAEEPEALLCLGGPKHNKSIAWRGEVWDYREKGKCHHYRWVKLALVRGDTELTTNIYVHDSEDEDYGQCQ